MKRATTSASNILQRALCPGSDAAEAQFEEADNEYSTEGTMLHSKFFDKAADLEGVTPEQREALDLANTLTLEFVDQFREFYQIPEDAVCEIEREVEMTLWRAAGEDPLFPGHADIIFTWPAFGASIIVDAKFGFMEVESAASNHQLASYACMHSQRSGVKHIGVCIVQPRNFGPRRSTAVYDAETIPAAHAKIVEIFDAAKSPHAKRKPGDAQCHFCKAKAACAEYTSQLSPLQTDLTQAPPLTAAVSLTNSQLERLYLAIAFGNAIAKDVTEEMRRRVATGAIAGYKLQNTGDTREVTDSIGLYQAVKGFLEPFGFKPMDYQDCQNIGWGKLEELTARLMQISEGQAKKQLADIIAPFVQATPKAKRIVRAK